MTSNKEDKGAAARARIVAEARRTVKDREAGYREKAMKMYPHVCGRCGREFEGKKVRELTVHHRDHNHDNNPPDGSNWELLCIYCHENEHSRYVDAEHYGKASPGSEGESDSGMENKPFADLAALLKGKR
ncbi:MAG: HNH nuclease family protein [Desulfobacterales bacterium]|nr:HNH nuclease family protein [Desulfobacterales bacterium]